MTRCAGCGYAAEDHQPDTRKCPVAAGCDCGRAPIEHAGLAPMPCRCFPGWPHWCGIANFEGRPCPGRWAAPGRWAIEYRGDYRAPQPYDRTLWREILARDAAARHADAEEAERPWEPEEVAPPLVPARAPQSKAEFAAGKGKQARGLGRLAIDAGWQVEARYWKAGDGTEGSAVRLRKGPLRAVATWIRKPGKTWVADAAYGWMLGSGDIPAKLSITKLEGVVRGN